MAEGVDEGCSADQAVLAGREPEEDALIVRELPVQRRQLKHLAHEPDVQTARLALAQEAPASGRQPAP